MRHGMGAEFLRLRPTAEDMQETSPQDIVVFREALIRNKTREGLFASEGEEITFLGGQLFRTRLHFPANVPTGFYDVEVFMLQNGSVVHAQTTPLIRSEEHTSELQSLMRISYAVFCLTTQKQTQV